MDPRKHVDAHTIFAVIAIAVALGFVACGGGGGGGASTAASSTQNVVGPTGGTATSADGIATVKVPAGALTASVAITILPSTANVPQGNIGVVLDVGPDGTTFSAPVTISLKYDPSIVPQGIAETSLTLAFASGSTWTDVPTTVDAVNKVLIGQTTHFSSYSAKITDSKKQPYGTMLGSINGVSVYSNGCVEPSKPCLVNPKTYPDSYNTNNASGYNSGWQWQCVEFVNRYYYQTFGKDIRVALGNAKDYYNLASTKGFVAYPNDGRNGLPQEGDVIVSQGNGTSNNVGHVAIVWKVDSKAIHLVEQNWHEGIGDLDHVLTISTGNKVADFSPAYPVTGWLRLPSPSPTVTATGPTIAAGTDHAVALKLDGSLWTWGSNRYYQLGYTATSTCSVIGASGSGSQYSCSMLPTLVGSGYSAVAAGNDFTVALKSDGSLWSWGSNFWGQLGNGPPAFTPMNIPINIFPAPVLIGDGYSAVAAGLSHTVALKSDGTLWSWGYNDYGQLGHASNWSCAFGPNNTTPLNCSMSPVQVDGVYSAVAAGGNSTLALKSDGSLWTWGSNANGQLGYSTTITCGPFASTCSLTPTRVGNGYSAMAEGGSFTLAVKSDGSLWAWGGAGLVGDGTNTQRNSPIQIGSSGYKAVAAGGANGYALKADGTLWAWGRNGYGEMGNGNTIPGYWALTPIQIGSGYIGVAAGGDFAVALKADGGLWTWGLNSSGQLGYATTTTCLVNPGLASQMNIPCAGMPVQVGSGYLRGH